MSEANKALVRQWFDEVWNKGRADAIDEMLPPEAVVHGLGDDLRGPDAFKPFHTIYRAAFPDMQITIDDLIAEGDRVAFRWSAVATHRGPLMGVLATGHRVRFTGMGILRIVDGKLIEGWNNFDQFTMLQQMGAVTVPG